MKLKIKSYAHRAAELAMAHAEVLAADGYESLSTIDKLKAELRYKVQCIKLADEYTTLTKQYANRRFARIKGGDTPIPPGPTLVQLLLSELPISDQFINVLDEQIEKLSPLNTYGYIAKTDHEGTVFFLLLYYGLRRDVEYLKDIFRTQNTGSFSTGLQNLYGPEARGGREVYTFAFAIPTTTPGIRDIRYKESTYIRAKIAEYARYMSDLRLSRLPSEEYKIKWMSAFTDLLQDFDFKSVTNKSESFQLAHAEVGQLDVEIRRLRDMIEALQKQ